MRTYGQFCPVAIAAEVLGERWTLLVVRELLCGSTRFNELRRGVPLMSPSLLSKRLKSLERIGVLERTSGDAGVEYRLTAAGEELRPVVETMGAWGQRWARAEVRPEHLDATLLMWDLHRNVSVADLPPGQVVVLFRIEGSSDGKSRYWLVLRGGEVDLCLRDPGHDVDVTVTGHVRVLLRYWMGEAGLEQLVRSGELAVTGPRHLVRALPSWFTGSVFATPDPAAGDRSA